MKLKVLTWNMSYGYGLGSEGTNYVPKDKVHFELTLAAMSEFIRNTEVDVVLLQEVDFDSHRSHHMDQLDILSRTTSLIYRTPIVTWDRAYVPYPGLNPKNQFGKIKSGGGILSRFPIQPVLDDLLPKPRENGKLYNFFYLSRFLQLVKIQGITLMNLHLEAFSQDNRELHLIKVQDRLKDYEVDIAAGDFNGDLGAPGTILADTEAQYRVLPAPTPTFPSNHPSEILDGFLVRKKTGLEVSVKTMDAGSVSDHFPVLLEVSF